MACARLVWFLALVVLFPSAARSADPVVGRGQALTMTGGGGSAGTGGGGVTAVPDLFTGSLSHAIPLDLPLGGRGVAPAIQLAYRSGNGEGYLGVGWDLELGAVERSLKGGVNHAGDEFVLRMSGAASELVYAGVDTGTYREYRSKIESDFKRVRKYTAADGRPYFEVTDRSGTRYLYGQWTASRQDDPGNPSRIFKWCLDLVVDVHGNFYTAGYLKNLGEIYPDTVRYTGYRAPASTWNPVTGSPGPATGDLQPAVSVRFYKDLFTLRPAARVYAAGFEVQSRHLLGVIEVKAGGLMVRAYRLTYGAGAGSGRQTLRSVQQYGADARFDLVGNLQAGTPLPSTTFAYTDGRGFVSGGTWLSGAFGSPWDSPYYQDRIRAIDVTGDGRTDLVLGPDEGGNWYVLESTGSGFVNRGAWLSGAYGGTWLTDIDGNPYYQPGWDGSPASIRALDVNADGKMDLVLGPDAQGTWYLLESTGSSFINRGARLVGFAGGQWSWADNQVRIHAVDVNGDGMTDLLVGPDGGGNWYVARSTGTSFVNDGVWLSGFAGVPWDANQNQARVRITDVNGDGMPDIVVGPDGGGNWYVARCTGTSFVNAGVWLSGFATAPWDDNQNQGRIRATDVNGDGKTDLVVGPDGAGNWAVALSTGTSFLNAGYWLSGFGRYPWDANQNQARIRAMDVNGDGKTDLVIGPDAGGNWYVARSTGAYFVDDGIWLSGFAGAPWDANGNQNRIRPTDVTGDGLPDLVVGPDGGGNWYVMRSRGPFPDLLSSVSNGIGGSASISWLPSTAYANRQLPFPVHTVQAIATGDGNGNTASLTFNYWGGYYHFGDREFRGFNYVGAYSPVGPDGERSYTETWFHQGNDTAPWVNDPRVAVGFMKGKAYASRTWEARSWGTYQENVTTYGGGATAPYFNAPSRVEAAACDTASGCLRRTATTFQYDVYGNVAREDRYGDVADVADDVTVTRAFLYNTAAWIVDRPEAEIVYAGAGIASPPVSARIAHTFYAYDGAADASACSQSSGAYPPTKGNLTAVVRWLNGGGLPLGGPDTRMAYDAYGNVVCTSDPDRRRTRFGYDATGTFQTSITNALDHVQTTAYFGVGGTAAYGSAACPVGGPPCGLYGQVKAVTDPNLATASITYDLFGRKAVETLPDGTSTSTAYFLGAVGATRVETTSSATGAWSAAYLDGLGRSYWTRRKGSSTGRVAATVTRFNPTGTVKQQAMPYWDTTGTIPADSALRWTTSSYDYLGRVTRTTLPDGSRTLSCYRDLDGSSATIDGNDHRRREVRDVRGNRIRVQEYRGTFPSCVTDEGSPYATTRYEYDRLGRPTAVVDAANTRFEAAYDTLGRKISQSDPDLGNWSYGYTPGGDRWWQQDAKGNRIYFQYDAIHRVTVKDYPTGIDVSYTYDDPLVANSKGRLTKMTDASGATTYQYDVMGRNTVRAQTIDGVWYTTGRSFDTAGRPSTVTYPDNAIAAYQYDADGFLCKVSSSTADTGCVKAASSYATYSYSPTNALGQVDTASFGNGVNTQFGYYDATSNRLRSIVTAGPAGTLLSLGYSYDAAGNVTSLTDLNHYLSQTLGYDELNRLTSSTSTVNGALTYSYGPTGNILAKEGVSYTQYDPIKVHAVRATSNGRAYDYDANGNMVAEYGETSRYFEYDYDNRVLSILIRTSPPTGTTYAATQFSYDGSGQRVKKQGISSTTRYVGKLYECTVTPSTCTKHIFAGEKRIASVTGAATRYYHADHLGTTRIVTNEAGFAVESLNYKPFGVAAYDSAPSVSKHKFTGQEYDPETGLYFYNARYYNPVLGRFVSPDTLAGSADPQMLNRYSYVRNSPLTLTDPTGHWPNWGKLWRWMTKPAVAFGTQMLLPGIGTAALLASKDGRNILAGEIIATTAVLSLACGGCGAYASGALVGEIAGAQGAIRGKGDVLSGVVVGGVTGALAAGMAGSINSGIGGWAAQIGKNAGQGAIMGVATGAAGAFAGGSGSAAEVLRGALRGAAVGAALGAMRPVIAGREITGEVGDELAGAANRVTSAGKALDLSPVKVRSGGLWGWVYEGWAGGGAFGNTVSVSVGFNLENTLTHELTHVAQWQADGALIYAFSYVYQRATIGYTQISYEKEAAFVDYSTR